MEKEVPQKLDSDKDVESVSERAEDSSAYFNSRIVYENACLDRGLAYYDYENFDIPWE